MTLNDMFLVAEFEKINLFELRVDSRLNLSLIENKVRGEYGEMETIHDSPIEFKNDLQNHFDWNSKQIAKLLDTYEITYNPITDYSINHVDNSVNEYTGKRTEHSDNFSESKYEHAHSAWNNQEEPELIDADKTVTTNDIEGNSFDNNTRTVNTNGNVTGINRNTYQDLIVKEREVAMFNIYDWILKNVISDTLVGIW